MLGTNHEGFRGVATFSVCIIEASKMALWREFWDRDEPTERSVAANNDGSLGKSVMVKATTKREAEKFAKEQNPGHVVIEKLTKRLH